MVREKLKIYIDSRCSCSGLASGILHMSVRPGTSLDGLSLWYDVHRAGMIVTAARERFELVDVEHAEWVIAETPHEDLLEEVVDQALAAGKKVAIFRPQDAAHAQAFPARWRDRPVLDIRRSAIAGDQDPRLLVLPAFPHTGWRPNNPDYWSSCPSRLVPMVGFMGQIRGRGVWLSEIESLLTDGRFLPWFVRCEGFGFNDHRTLPARRQVYLQHLKECDFILCPRGAGLYTYRFFEALSADKVPVVHSGVGLPPIGGKDWDEHVIRFDETKEIPDRILDFWKRDWPPKGLLRKLWTDHLSPDGFLGTIYERMCACTSI